MLRLAHYLIALAFCFPLASPQAHACMGVGMEYTIFFNANALPLFIENLGQKPPNAVGMVELNRQLMQM